MTNSLIESIANLLIASMTNYLLSRFDLDKSLERIFILENIWLMVSRHELFFSILGNALMYCHTNFGLITKRRCYMQFVFFYCRSSYIFVTNMTQPYVILYIFDHFLSLYHSSQWYRQDSSRYGVDVSRSFRWAPI